MFDIIIIGAGPAGLTAALYAGRAGKKVLVLEAKNYGGQIINSGILENYPGLYNVTGYDFSTTLYKQVLDVGVEVKYETVKRVTKELLVITDKNEYTSKAIIIATGLSRKKLKLENEEELIGKGVSYCAVCDGNFYKGKDVMVVGGGNSALEEAIYLSNIANKVYLVHRRNNFTGENTYIEKIKSINNIEILYNSTVEKINKNNVLESVDINLNGEIKNIKVSGLFVAIGLEANNEIFKDLLELNSFGYIKSHDTVFTSVKNIYVAGDTRDKELRQLTTATSDGALAATMAIKNMED